MHSWLALLVMAAAIQQPQAQETEARIVDYLRDAIDRGRRIEVSELVNEVFTTPREREAVSRLYDTFFKIPMFLVQFHEGTGTVPSLRQISEQFAFTAPGTADVILRLMEADPRVPDFFERDPETGQITSITVDAIRDHPQFGQAVERTIAGWEGRRMPPFATETFDGNAVSSEALAGRPHMVYVWFSNCPPCLQTAPLLVALHEEYAEAGFEIFAANADRFLELPYDDQTRADYVEQVGMEDFILGYLTPEMHDAYGGVSIFPTMFFVDRTGTVVRHFVNFQEKPVLEDAIQAALE